MPSVDDAAEHLFMSRQRFQQLQKAGVIPRFHAGDVDMDVCREAYIEHLRQGAAGRQKTTPKPAKGALDLEQERARLAKEQADKLERERLVAEGRLLVAESVKAALVHCFSSVNGRLGAMPAKLAHVIRPDDPRTARRHLEAAVEELRAELRAVEIQGFEVPEGGAKH